MGWGVSGRGGDGGEPETGGQDVRPTSAGDGCARDRGNLAGVRPRLSSLDAFRGLTMAAMVVVNNPGTWGAVYPPLRHADWHGCTPTDLIFPFFLLAVGMALALSAGPDADGRAAPARWGRVLRRTAVLFALGITLNAAGPVLRGLLRDDWAGLASVRLPGVLQRIALCYMLVSVLVVWVGVRVQAAVAALVLAGYGAAMLWSDAARGFTITVPATASSGPLAEDNLARSLDRLLLPAARLYGGSPTDPEGLLSTLPACATTVIGYWMGLLLRRGSASAGRGCVLSLAVGGGVLMAAGWLAALIVPLNKPLWTPSYVLFTAGIGALVMALLHWLIDERGRRGWARPLEALGVNAIFLFVASGLVARVMAEVSVSGRTLRAWVFDSVCVPLAGGPNENASLLFAVGTLAAWWAVLWLMWRRGWVVKV